MAKSKWSIVGLKPKDGRCPIVWEGKLYDLCNLNDATLEILFKKGLPYLALSKAGKPKAEKTEEAE